MIVSDFGHSASEATEVLGVISLGGIIGSIGLGVIARFLPIRALMVICLASAAVGVASFPYFTETPAKHENSGIFHWPIYLRGDFGFFFGLFAASYPSSLLGSGSGLVLGIGRGGAVLGPMIPGFLFTAGLALETVALLMAGGSFLAGIAVLLLRPQPIEPTL